MMKTLAEPWFHLGYVTPHPLVDNVPYQFYRIAPDGVMLMLANLEIGDYTIAAVEHELPLFWKHVAALAKAGASRVVLTGVPVSAALGRERVLAMIAEAPRRAGRAAGHRPGGDCRRSAAPGRGSRGAGHPVAPAAQRLGSALPRVGRNRGSALPSR